MGVIFISIAVRSANRQLDRRTMKPTFRKEVDS